MSVSLTASSFGLMLVTTELWHLYVILFLNGFFQTGVWGGIIYFVGKYAPKEIEGFASKFLATGISVLMLFCLRALMSLIGAYVPLRHADRIEVGKFL